ncbi:MAG: pyruvate ferredoxin oxidoreductase [Candidatus Aenigmatarchaeota archaeon]|nr:MAG: pyruvate ferredoxin oxidoreductase [Candidatus Aenigmarchaeota archaeon]
MAKDVISGAQAVAEAVKMCNPAVIAAYPITPQTHIAEGLAQMLANGEFDAEMVRVESEQSSMAACIGASSMGVRAYTATASQGLALMHEMLFAASGMRLPIVMSVANRSLNSPLSIWNDQQDSFASRDAGWVQLYVEDAQEAFDTHVQAFKIAEEIRLPVMVCLDGFVITHTYEPVDIPSNELIGKFLPKIKPKDNLNPSKPITLGGVGAPEHYIFFRKQQQDAMEKAHDAIQKANIEYSSAIGRKHGDGLIDTANMKDAKHAIITIGSVAGTIRPLLEKENMGLIRVRSLRPFPAEEIRNACRGLESVGVLEKDISIGANGAIYDEVRSALYSEDNKPRVSGFIAGLGGRDITEEHIGETFKKIREGKEGTEWLS